MNRTSHHVSTLRRIALSGAALAVCAVVVQGQGASEEQRARALNSQLLRLHGQALSASPAEAAALHSQAALVIAQRAAALSLLTGQDPARALALAFPPDLLAALAAAFPQSAAQLESHGVWQGPIEYIVIDEQDWSSHRSVRRMRVGQEVLEIHFADGEPPGLKSGDILTVTGVRFGSQVAAAGGEVEGSVVAAAACSLTGDQRSAVLLVTFPGVTPSLTPSAAYNMFFGSGRSLDGYWREVSYNQASASGNVFGWYTLGRSYTCDEYSALRTAAIAAADPEVDFRNYTRLFIVFPKPAGCTWGGLGTLGCSTLSSADGSFTASTSWMISNYMSSNDQGVMLAAHEGGHNLTLHHARSRDFGSEALGPLGATGTLDEYGDRLSSMGYWNLGHYASPHKVRLGWIPSANVQTVQGPGSYSLRPYELSVAGLQALKVQRGAGNDAWLWVEYRRPEGNYDTTLPSQIYSGALIHYQDAQTSSRTDLLDFTPETSSFSDPALAAGKTWSDPYTNVSVSATGATASALTLSVSYGPIPCTEAAPSVAISPSNPSVEAGNNVNYTVSVTNNDSAGCSASTFGLSSSLPSGWPTAFSQTSLSLTPGQTGSVTMTKSVPGGTEPGTYAVDAAASRSGPGGVGTANCSVTAPRPPLTARASVPGSTYSPRSTVPVTATVLSGSNPASGAAVTITVTQADGKRSNKTLTADSNGQATWNYRLGPKDPPGTYSANAQANYGSQTATSNTVTFTVQ